MITTTMRISFLFMIPIAWDLGHSMVILKFADIEKFFDKAKQDDTFSLNEEFVEQRALICACVTKSRVFTELYNSPSALLPKHTAESSIQFDSMASFNELSLSFWLENRPLADTEPLLEYIQIELEQDGEIVTMNLLPCLSTTRDQAVVYYIAHSNAPKVYFVFARQQTPFPGATHDVKLIGFAEPGPIPNYDLLTRVNVENHFVQSLLNSGQTRDHRQRVDQIFFDSLDDSERFLLCAMAYDSMEVTDAMHTHRIVVATRGPMYLKFSTNTLFNVYIQTCCILVKEDDDKSEAYSIIRDPNDKYSMFVTTASHHVVHEGIFKVVVRLRHHFHVPADNRIFTTREIH